MINFSRFDVIWFWSISCVANAFGWFARLCIASLDITGLFDRRNRSNGSLSNAQQQQQFTAPILCNAGSIKYTSNVPSIAIVTITNLRQYAECTDAHKLRICIELAFGKRLWHVSEQLPLSGARLHSDHQWFEVNAFKYAYKIENIELFFFWLKTTFFPVFCCCLN